MGCIFSREGKKRAEEKTRSSRRVRSSNAGNNAKQQGHDSKDSARKAKSRDGTKDGGMFVFTAAAAAPDTAITSAGFDGHGGGHHGGGCSGAGGGCGGGCGGT